MTEGANGLKGGREPAGPTASEVPLDWRKPVIALSFAGFLVQADRSIMPVFLPLMARELHSTIPAVSASIVAYLLPYGLLQLAFGPLADRFGERRIAMTAFGVMGVGILLSALAPSAPTLIAARAAVGMGAAGVPPLSLSLLPDLTPVAHRSGALSRYMSVSFMGQLFSTAVGGSIAVAVGWRAVMLAYGLLSLAVLCSLIVTLGSWTDAERTGRRSFLSSYTNLLRAPNVAVIFPAIALQGFLINGQFSFLGGFFAENRRLTGYSVALLLSLFAVAAVIGGPASKRLWTGSLNRSTALAASVAAGSALLLVAFPTRIAPGVLSTLLLGFSFIVGQNAFLTTVGRLSNDARSTSMAMVALCFMGAGAVGVQVGSLVIGGGSYRLFFTVWGTLALATAAFNLIMLPSKKA